jgi:hypothetical protein
MPWAATWTTTRGSAPAPSCDVIMRLATLLLLLSPCSASLVADGAWIVNESTRSRVTLHCVSFRDLDVARFLGANCVRYPTDQHDEWGGQVDNITRRGMLPVLAYEGRTQTRAWVETLENLTRRHSFALVDIGVPVEPEMWGVSTDFFRDWMAAATTVCFRLHRIDPAVLISVGAFCWVDLRHMMDSIGPGDAYERGKLVYSVRVTPDMFWWNGTGLFVVNLLALLLSFVCGLAGCSLYEGRYAAYGFVGSPRKHDVQTAIAASMLFHAALLLGTVLFIVSISRCGTVADDVSWLLVVEAVCLGLATTYVRHWDCRSRAFLSMCCFWAALYFLLIGAFTLYLLTPEAYQHFLGMMSLEGRPVPVFVAEAGAADFADPSWKLVWDYVGKAYALDLAWGEIKRSELPGLWATTVA